MVCYLSLLFYLAKFHLKYNTFTDGIVNNFAIWTTSEWLSSLFNESREWVGRSQQFDCLTVSLCSNIFVNHLDKK